ncbi:transposase [Streptomyces inhibens]|uniref:transposase n=1 Tax=Streptomyces inhibens TaxID=2293571 RepID=UPI00402A67B8
MRWSSPHARPARWESEWPPTARGLPWRGLPERFGPWRTMRGRFARGAIDGTFERLLSS